MPAIRRNHAQHIVDILGFQQQEDPEEEFHAHPRAVAAIFIGGGALIAILFLHGLADLAPSFLPRLLAAFI